MSRVTNDNVDTNKFDRTVLSDREFKRLSEFIYGELGIKMPESKKTMLTSRLQKRVRRLMLNSFTEYCEYLFSPEGIENELIHMIDVVTTNKTDFFREPAHFDYMVKNALPELVALNGAGVRKDLMVWSAGCSTGEEPYTLAIILNEFAATCPGVRFKHLILATDISTRVLETAKRGVYLHERVDPVALNLRKKYLLKGKNKSSGLVRIAPELRTGIRFRRLNFMDGDFGMREQMDIIFCRNVMIYFDRKTQENLLNRFCRHLVPGGYVFIGHSETLNGMDLPLTQVAPTIYRKDI